MKCPKSHFYVYASLQFFTLGCSVLKNRSSIGWITYQKESNVGSASIPPALEERRWTLAGKERIPVCALQRCGWLSAGADRAEQLVVSVEATTLGCWPPFTVGKDYKKAHTPGSHCKLLLFLLFLVLLFLGGYLETGPHSVAQAALELAGIPLPQLLSAEILGVHPFFLLLSPSLCHL